MGARCQEQPRKLRVCPYLIALLKMEIDRMLLDSQHFTRQAGSSWIAIAFGRLCPGFLSYSGSTPVTMIER